MRILLTYFTFPPSANGIARYLGDIEKGHNVEIVCGGLSKKAIGVYTSIIGKESKAKEQRKIFGIFPRQAKLLLS